MYNSLFKRQENISNLAINHILYMYFHFFYETFNDVFITRD